MKENKLEFTQVLAQAPSIEAYSEEGPSAGTTILKSTQADQKHNDKPYADRTFIKGTGVDGDPYEYLSAAGVSPHYAVVNLWFLFRPKTEFSSTPLIRVNDWMFKCLQDGVQVWPGGPGNMPSFAKLLPKKREK